MTALNQVATRMDAPDALQRISAPITPMEMVQQAVERGASLDIVERLMGLHERWEAQQARKAFDEAIAQAKAEIPVIGKNRTVDFTSQKGRTNYRHEDLGEIARVVSPILGKHGLSFRFKTTTENKAVTVTCIISHRDGHSEENTLVATHDDSGNKNSIQALGSAVTYLQRYTLKAALGLAASNDDDGASTAKDAGLKPTITAQQVEQIRQALVFREVPEERALKRFKVETLEDIYAVDFDACLRLAQNAGAKA